MNRTTEELLALVFTINKVPALSKERVALEFRTLGTTLGIEFPKVVVDFYATLGINSVLFSDVFSDLSVNERGDLEFYCNIQTGDTWAIQLKGEQHLWYRPFDEEWRRVSFTVDDFLSNEVLVTSCFNQPYFAQGYCTKEALDAAITAGTLRVVYECEIAPMKNLASRHPFQMLGCQSVENDLLLVGFQNNFMGNSYLELRYGANSKSDFEKFVKIFGLHWSAPWLDNQI